MILTAAMLAAAAALAVLIIVITAPDPFDNGLELAMPALDRTVVALHIFGWLGLFTVIGIALWWAIG